MQDVRSRQMSKLPGSQGIFAARWSPDGWYIVALNNDSIHRMLCDVRERKWRNLKTSGASRGYLSWTPDSTRVCFDTLLSGNAGYFSLRISDSKLDKIDRP